jgi:hypothetical protein
MPLLASVYGNFHPAVLAYLHSRHFNLGVTEMRPLPVCPVTTGLLVALHYTGHGKTDLVDIVIKMDNYD